MKTPWWIHWYTAWLVVSYCFGRELDMKKSGAFVARHTKVRLE